MIVTSRWRPMITAELTFNLVRIFSNSSYYSFFDHPVISEEPGHRTRRIPRPFYDTQPLEEDLNYSDNADSQDLSTQNSTAVVPAQFRIRHVLLTLRDTLQTAFNLFGLSRLYPRRPSFEPNKYVPSSLLAQTCPTINEGVDSLPKVFEPPYPFANMTIY